MALEKLTTADAAASVVGIENERKPVSLDVTQAWLTTVHELEAGEQRRQLLSLLRAVPTVPRYSQPALDSIMQLDQAWYPVAAKLDRSFRRNAITVTDRPVQFHQEMAEVSLVFGETYAGFVHEFSAIAQTSGVPDSRLPNITALALFHFGRYAKFLYCKNELPDAQFWQRLHALQSLATSSGFVDERLALFANGDSSATCGELWLRTIMLATLSSGNLSPRQLDRTEEWLEGWCVRITVDSTYDASQHVYCVDIAGTRGPQLIIPELKLSKPLYLCTKYLHQDIVVARKEIVENSMTSSIGWYAENPLQEYLELLDRLPRIWAFVPSPKSRRASVRTPGSEGGQLEVVRGFAGILALRARGEKPKIESFAIVDQSDLGFGLCAPLDERGGLRHMELLALRSSAGKEWQIGVIAWTTRMPGNKGRLAGVDLLSHTAILVSLTKAPAVSDVKSVRPKTVVRETANPEVQADQVLYLVGDVPKNQTDSLIAPIGLHAPGDRVQLRTASNAFIICINRVIQSGEGWERIGFQVLEKVLTKSN